jgi:hypothetical protein
MRFTFKREAMIMTALLTAPAIIGLVLRLLALLVGR